MSILKIQDEKRHNSCLTINKKYIKKTVEFRKYLSKKYPYQDQYEWDYTTYQARKV